MRRADVVDAPMLAELFEAMRDENDRPDGEGAFADGLAQWMELDGARHLTWVAETDGTPVGMVWLALTSRVPRPHLGDRWSGDLQTFWVRPELRGHGIGRALLDALLAEADRRGLERVVVHSSDGAIPLYRRAGFDVYERLLNRRLPGA